jgi:hypothetical protein
VTGDWAEPLDALRWHWGSAYVINCHGLGRWTAERRDTHETLRDRTPMGLRGKIIADYSARRVPRDLSGQPPGQSLRPPAKVKLLVIEWLAFQLSVDIR